MPDISMCNGGECPWKDKCYRFMAYPNPYHQAYFTDPPWKDNTCDYFMKYYEQSTNDKIRMLTR